ncbi:hypothetical protein AVEN_203350-1 [Araneus ventricosus]|uniref:Uncharacterized protein n=1 Tax=Araneus ventricosus TaxID=182803 RepID=A0A4Y2N297_ARAVE|nr:hypothetical protein AVEN_203350-1 [Araneus ventricosus]
MIPIVSLLLFSVSSSPYLINTVTYHSDAFSSSRRRTRPIPLTWPAKNTPKRIATFLFVFLSTVLYSSPPKFSLPSIAKNPLHKIPQLISFLKRPITSSRLQRKFSNHRPTLRISRNPEGGGQQVQSSVLKMAQKLNTGENRNTFNKTDRIKRSDIDFLLKHGFYGKH